MAEMIKKWYQSRHLPQFSIETQNYGKMIHREGSILGQEILKIARKHKVKKAEPKRMCFYDSAPAP